jgi:CheY-like chemotaxis protein
VTSNVLVVDDVPDSCRVLVRALEVLGHAAAR